MIAKNRGIDEHQIMSTQELINTRKEILKIGLEKTAKKQNISKNELNQTQKL